MPDGTSGQGPTPEDEIDRKLRELAEDVMGEARFKEPTAAERTKRAARDRKQAQRNQRRQRRHAGSRRLKVGVIAFVVLAAAGSIVWLRLSHSQAGSPSGVQPGGGQGTGGTAPADPFAGTAAAKWADGESGIVIPSAKPVGNFTTAQVKGAYEATRRLLIAALAIQAPATATYIPPIPVNGRLALPSRARHQPVLISHIGARWRCRLRADNGYLTAGSGHDATMSP